MKRGKEGIGKGVIRKQTRGGCNKEGKNKNKKARDARQAGEMAGTNNLVCVP